MQGNVRYGGKVEREVVYKGKRDNGSRGRREREVRKRSGI